MKEDFLAVVQAKRFLGREFLTWLVHRIEDVDRKLEFDHDVVELVLGDRVVLEGGTGDYKQSEDALRVRATTTAIPLRERMAFTILDFDDEKGTLAMEWEKLRVGVKFTTGTREKVLAQIRALQGNDWRPYNGAARYLFMAGIEPALAMQLVDRSIHRSFAGTRRMSCRKPTAR